MRLSLSATRRAKPEQRLDHALAERVSKIDNLADKSSSLSGSLQSFYQPANVSPYAEDPAARQALIGKAEGLVSQNHRQYLRDQDN